ncbi:MAG: tetratricopeptide repeat protein [Spirochaetes bacterium]|nr:tetratricopeptide repeat protein [Spirochaetota bacterium]
MKSLLVIILMLAVPALAEDQPRTEEIINAILDAGPEEKTADQIKGTASLEKVPDAPGAVSPPPPGDKKAAPAIIVPPRPKESRESEESAPRVTGEEQLLLKTGIDFYNNGLYDHSLRKFQDLSAKFPSGMYRDSARFWMGKIYMKQYRYDDAIREFAAVSAESGDYPAAIFYSGESSQMKGDRIASIEYYQKVQAQFPSHELADKALLNAGMLYLEQRKGTQALDSAVRIIKYYKDRATVDDAYYLMGKIYEKDPQLKDVEIARRIYRQFLNKGESDDRFGSSPLKKRVEEDLLRVEKTYFRMEK